MYTFFFRSINLYLSEKLNAREWEWERVSNEDHIHSTESELSIQFSLSYISFGYFNRLKKKIQKYIYKDRGADDACTHLWDCLPQLSDNWPSTSCVPSICWYPHPQKMAKWQQTHDYREFSPPANAQMWSVYRQTSDSIFLFCFVFLLHSEKAKKERKVGGYGRNN